MSQQSSVSKQRSMSKQAAGANKQHEQTMQHEPGPHLEKDGLHRLVHVLGGGHGDPARCEGDHVDHVDLPFARHLQGLYEGAWLNRRHFKMHSPAAFGVEAPPLHLEKKKKNITSAGSRQRSRATGPWGTSGSREKDPDSVFREVVNLPTGFCVELLNYRQGFP